METDGPLGSSAVCGSDVKKRKRKKKVIPPLKVPDPCCTLPGGGNAPYQAPGLSDLTSPLCPEQEDTEDWSLVFSVLYSWLSFVCGMWLTALGSFFFVVLFLAFVWPAIHPDCQVCRHFYFLLLSGAIMIFLQVTSTRVWSVFITARKALVLCASVIIHVTYCRTN